MDDVRRIRRDGGFFLNPKGPKCHEKKVLIDGDSQKVTFLGLKTETCVTGSEWIIRRRMVKEVINLFRENLRKISRERGGETHYSDHLKAAKTLERRGKWVNGKKQFGHVPGIRIGDTFRWRAELKIIGLHCQLINGIDYMKVSNGKALATSIVDSGRYANDVSPPHTLIYCGHGGNPNATGQGKLNDQKLECGNLALKCSMEERVPVRVIRKFQRTASVGARTRKNSKGYKYVYDGLYVVDNYWRERGQFGKLIFKFLLRRIPGQLELNWGKVLS